MSTCTTSKVLVDKYLKGRDILIKDPQHRTDEELSLLRKWLIENFTFFKNMDSGKKSEQLFAVKLGLHGVMKLCSKL